MILVPQGEDIPPAARAASSRRTATSALGREGRVGTNTSAHQYRHIEGRPKHPGKTALAFALKDATKTAIWTVVPGKTLDVSVACNAKTNTAPLRLNDLIRH